MFREQMEFLHQKYEIIFFSYFQLWTTMGILHEHTNRNNWKSFNDRCIMEFYIFHICYNTRKSHVNTSFSIYISHWNGSFKKVWMKSEFLSKITKLFNVLILHYREDRGKITMLQCIGWTLGICILPIVFALLRDWKIFLVLTSIPGLFFVLYPK